MRMSIMILAVLSIIFLIGAGAMGLSLETKPNLKKAHMHMALTAASLSILTHILSLIFMSKAKKEDAAPAS